VSRVAAAAAEKSAGRPDRPDAAIVEQFAQAHQRV
jgi:hypothetical protein